MNMKLLLNSGKVIENPTPDNIREILNQSDDFWRYGEADIKTDKDHIIFNRNEKYGYFILDKNYNKAPLGNEEDKNLFVVYGKAWWDAYLFPLCCHLTYSQVENILLHFIQYTELIDYEKWYNIYEIQNHELELMRRTVEVMKNCKHGEILRIEGENVIKFNIKK